MSKDNDIKGLVLYIRRSLTDGRYSTLQLGLSGALCFALFFLPFAVSSFWVRIGLQALMWIGLAHSWNMIGGYAGYLDFGHGIYYGVGAFLTAILMSSYGVAFVFALPIAGFVSVILAYLVAVPTLRLRGAYFAIATWVFAEGVKQLALVSGESAVVGLSLPTDPGSFGLPVGELTETLFYYLMLSLTILTVALTYYLFERSEFGYKVKAQRDHQQAAEALGIDTTRIKRQVYVLSCLVAALFGCVSAYHTSYIHPSGVMSPLITDQKVIMVLFGGLGTVAGPVLGGVFIYLLSALTPLFLGTSTLYIVFLGLILVAVVLFAPEGIVGLVRGEGSKDIKKNFADLKDKYDL